MEHDQFVDRNEAESPAANPSEALFHSHRRQSGVLPGIVDDEAEASPL
jgi:hypothetical protein